MLMFDKYCLYSSGLELKYRLTHMVGLFYLSLRGQLARVPIDLFAASLPHLRFANYGSPTLSFLAFPVSTAMRLKPGLGLPRVLIDRHGLHNCSSDEN